MKLAPEVRVAKWIIRIIATVVLVMVCFDAMNEANTLIVAGGALGLLVIVLGTIWDIRTRVTKKVKAALEKEIEE